MPIAAESKDHDAPPSVVRNSPESPGSAAEIAHAPPDLAGSKTRRQMPVETPAGGAAREVTAQVLPWSPLFQTLFASSVPRKITAASRFAVSRGSIASALMTESAKAATSQLSPASRER